MKYVIWPSISCSSKMGYASLSEWDPRNSFKLYHGFQITIIGIWFYQRIQICFPIGKWLSGLLCLSFYFGTFKVCVLEIRITCKMRNPIVGFNSCSSWTNDSFFPSVLNHWIVSSCRDVECSGSSSFGSYSGYFGPGKSSEISNSGQDSSLLSELSGTQSLRLQLGGQCSYIPYNVSLLNDKFQPVSEMNIQENPVDYHVSGSLEVPRPGFDTTPGSWASTSGPCEVTLFDEPLYSQASSLNCGVS